MAQDLSIADLVIGLECYLPQDLTARAKEVAKAFPANVSEQPSYGSFPNRIPILPAAMREMRQPTVKSKTFIPLPMPQPGPTTADDPMKVDIAGLDQLVEVGQAKLAAEILRYLARRQARSTPKQTLRSLLDEVEQTIQHEGMDAIQVDEFRDGDLVFARRLEVGAALSRVRGLKVA